MHILTNNAPKHFLARFLYTKSQLRTPRKNNISEDRIHESNIPMQISMEEMLDTAKQGCVRLYKVQVIKVSALKFK